MRRLLTLLWTWRIQRATAFVLALTVVFASVVIVIAAVLDHTRRTERITQSEEQAQHFVSAAEAAINSSLLGVDVLLASVDNLLDISKSAHDWMDPATASHLIQNAMRQNLLVSRLALVEPDGSILASSDRKPQNTQLALPGNFFKESFSAITPGLTIAAPVMSFQSSEQVLYFARPLHFSDGRPLLVVAEVPVSQLARVLIQGANIDGLQATLERGDGTLLAATGNTSRVLRSHLEPPLNALQAAGTTSGTAIGQTPALARLTPVPAIVMVRTTLYRDVYVTASIPVAAALRDWRREISFIHGFAALLITLILAAATFTLWYLDRLQRAQASIARGKEVLDQALGSMVSGFILLDAHHCAVTWNRQFLVLHPWLIGIMEPDIPFRTLVEVTAGYILPGSTADTRAQWVEQRMASLASGREDRQVTFGNGIILEITERATPDGGVVIVYQDVTRLRRAIADAESLAFYDPLTGLPNRRLLNDRLQRCIDLSAISGQFGVLMFLDLDHFKTLNDTAGHEMGDLLLQQVAQRLKSCVREEDTVARLGGDEFVVLLDNLSPDLYEAKARARRVGENILAQLTQPYRLQLTEYSSTCSIGAALFGRQTLDTTELLKHADIAMYQVKNTGRNGLCFFDPDMLAAITGRADMERDLRHAKDAGQFVLHFQVQVGASGQAVGAEVLLRWLHPTLGLVAPIQFIGLAEETGLILGIGAWVLQHTCLQIKAWERDPVLSALPLAVNVSARQFRSPTFVQEVSRVLSETGINPRLLKLELTESLMLDNMDETIVKMQQLKALGVRFSIDDFGTGYSSLAYLTQLPIDQLKIDRSFVRNIGVQTSDAAVIDSIIGLARSLGLEVIAEGVETNAQREFLALHGCANCQGYLFGRPQPLEAFEASLHALGTPLQVDAAQTTDVQPAY